MSTVISCYKWIVDEADIRVNADLSIDTSRAKGKISEYDKNVIEAGNLAAAALGGNNIALSFGTGAVKQSLKDALSRGPQEAVWVNGGQEAAMVDGVGSSHVLAAAIKTIDDVSLVICAEGSGDAYARQTAPRLGALLDLPVITSVAALELNGNTLTAVRKLENIEEKVEVTLPAVIAVLPEINPAPLPGLKAIMGANKKPAREIGIGDLGVDFLPRTMVLSQKGYESNRKNIVIKDGDAASKVNELVAMLRKDGVI